MSGRGNGTARAGSDTALIDRFLEMMAAEQGAAANTLAAYRSDLVLASQALDGDLAHADAAAIARLAEGWSSLAGATVARKAAALRRFYAFLHAEGDIAVDPAAALPRPGTARRLPKVLGHADVDRLFAVLGQRTAMPQPLPGDLRLPSLHWF